METPETLLTVADVARILNVGRSWVYAQCEDPHSSLPVTRIGRYLRFEPTAIAAYISSNRKEGCK